MNIPTGITRDIPTISLQRFRDGLLSAQDMRVLALACEDHGFFLLDEHGCEDVVTSVFERSAAFFALPRAEKMRVVRNELNPLGYFDRELTKQRRDRKEVFDFKAGGYISKNPARQTRWPDAPAEFRPVLTAFFEQFTALSEEVMRMIFLALGMPRVAVDETMNAGFGPLHSSAARLNYYPAADPVPDEERAGIAELGDMALHHHTDPGAITLLLQDDHGGLQARSRQHGWIDVPPRPGTIVINIGDVMQVWTNDRCTAGIHRVLPVRSDSGRFSTPFFFQPRYDAQVTPWVEAGEQPHYETFSWRDFIRGRVTDNFADYGDEDIQIERYRIAS